MSNPESGAAKVSPSSEGIDVPEAGAHPVSTGVGLVGGGATGAALGLVVGGPVASVIGAVIGAVAGGFGGHAIGESMEDRPESKDLVAAPEQPLAESVAAPEQPFESSVAAEQPLSELTTPHPAERENAGDNQPTALNEALHTHGTSLEPSESGEWIEAEGIPSHQAIAAKAWSYYEADGMRHGGHLRHWFQAEQELRQTPSARG